MAETLSLGGLTLDPDTAWFTIHRTGILGGTKRLNYVRNVWDIKGYVKATPGLSNAASKAMVDSKVVQLEGRIRDGMDVVFSLGSTMSLLSSNCISGTHVKSFSWLAGYDGVRGSGAEALLRRTYHLQVYGDIGVTSDTNITQWRESIHSVGSGGPHIVPVVSIFGTVQPQQLTNYSPFYVVQAGRATGLTDFPVAPLPAYTGVSGVYYDPSKQSVTKVSPAKWGINRNTEFTVRWNYVAWSGISLLGGGGWSPFGPLGSGGGIGPLGYTGFTGPLGGVPG